MHFKLMLAWHLMSLSHRTLQQHLLISRKVLVNMSGRNIIKHVSLSIPCVWAYKCADDKPSPAQRSSCCSLSPPFSPSLLWSCWVDSTADQCPLALHLQQKQTSWRYGLHTAGVLSVTKQIPRPTILPLHVHTTRVSHHAQDQLFRRSSGKSSTRQVCSLPPQLVWSNECSCDTSLLTPGF